MLVNAAFYWSLGQIFNEIFNGFSSRLLSGTGTSRTRPLHRCGSNSDRIPLQNESSGYDTTISQVPTQLNECNEKYPDRLNAASLMLEAILTKPSDENYRAILEAKECPMQRLDRDG
jgi:hypothetical protein